MTPRPHSSRARSSAREGGRWWEQLGLSGPTPSQNTVTDLDEAAAIRKLLESYPPQVFGTGPVSFDELIEKVAGIRKAHTSALKDRATAQYELLWFRLDAAEALPNATEVLTDEPWEGFTVAEVISWLWVLLDFEPRGFAGPYAMERMHMVRDLKDGRIPHFHFNYPQRARDLKEDGNTPRQYLERREERGTVPFHKDDVTFS